MEHKKLHETAIKTKFKNLYTKLAVFTKFRIYANCMNKQKY